MFKLGLVNAIVIERMKYVDYTRTTGRREGNLSSNFTLAQGSVEDPS